MPTRACPPAGRARRAVDRPRPACAATAALLAILLGAFGARPFAAGLPGAPWDRLAHLAAFALLAVLLWRVAGGRRPMLPVGIAAALGALDAWRHAPPGGGLDPADLLTDVAAALLAVVVLETGRAAP